MPNQNEPLTPEIESCLVELKHPAVQESLRQELSLHDSLKPWTSTIMYALATIDVQAEQIEQLKADWRLVAEFDAARDIPLTNIRGTYFFVDVWMLVNGKAKLGIARENALERVGWFVGGDKVSPSHYILIHKHQPLVPPELAAKEASLSETGEKES